MIEYEKGSKYVLRSDATFLLSFAPPETVFYRHITFYADRKLIITKGFPWDGMSGGVIDTKSSMQGGCMHDAGYMLIRQGLLSMSFRPLFDDELRKICIEDKMWKWRANSHRKGLEVGGRGAALPSAIRRVYRAP